MNSSRLSTPVVKAILAALALGVLAGCASDPRYSQGLEWVMSNEAEKRRLQAAGFPQYNDGF
jgi:uncharacterized lipoprotein